MMTRFLRRLFAKPTTCSDAGRLGNAIKRDRARAKRVAKAIDMARNAGRDDLIKRLENVGG